MRIFIIDTNVVFSCFLNSQGKIGDLVLNSRDCFVYYAPAYLRLEIEKHKEKIKEISGFDDLEIAELSAIIFSRIKFINERIIPFETWMKSSRIIRDVDGDDIAFLAASIHMDEDLWTSDKRLYKGLKSKGYDKLITTDELYQLRDKIRKDKK
ncbi:MAG: PIN domain-containing protein [Cyanobacteria bacterium J06649_11]